MNTASVIAEATDSFGVFGSSRGSAQAQAARDRAELVEQLLAALEAADAEAIVPVVRQLVLADFQPVEEAYPRLLDALSEHISAVRMGLEVRILALALRSLDMPGVTIAFEAIGRWLVGGEELHPGPAEGIMDLIASPSRDTEATAQRELLARRFSDRLLREARRYTGDETLAPMRENERGWFKAVADDLAWRLIETHDRHRLLAPALGAVRHQLDASS